MAEESAAKGPIVYYPFVFAAFPIVSLLATNANKVVLGQAVMPILAVESLAVLLWFALAPVVKAPAKRGLCVTAFFILFYVYGDAVNMARSLLRYEAMLRTWHVFAVLAMVVSAFAAGIFLLLRSKRSFLGLTRFLNRAVVFATAAAVILLIFALVRPDSAPAEERVIIATAGGENYPDIYYLLLDGYGRDDILEELYSFDNTPFLEFLESRGFYVARGSFANYCRTIQSLASTLNWMYLEEMTKEVGERTMAHKTVWGMVVENKTLDFLRERGYRAAAFSTGFGPTELRDARIFLRPAIDFSEFQNRLIEMTPLRSILNRYRSNILYHAHRERVRFTLRNVGKIDVSDGPWFVFCHVIAPHPPFVLDAAGEAIEPDRPFSHADGSFFQGKGGSVEEYIQGYRGQLSAVNSLVMNAIDEILEGAPEAIVIIQGDHGPGSQLDWNDLDKVYFKERMGILNAIRTPGRAAREMFYDNLSPVNTFRIIINEVFDGDLELLADESYFSEDMTPFRFVEVTDDVQRAE